MCHCGHCSTLCPCLLAPLRSCDAGDRKARLIWRQEQQELKKKLEKDKEKWAANKGLRAKERAARRKEVRRRAVASERGMGGCISPLCLPLVPLPSLCLSLVPLP